MGCVNSKGGEVKALDEAEGEVFRLGLHVRRGAQSSLGRSDARTLKRDFLLRTDGMCT